MKQFLFNPPYVFDNDCLASFLWVKRLDILTIMFPHQLVTTAVVVNELSRLKRGIYSWVYQQLMGEISSGTFRAVDFSPSSKEAIEFFNLVRGSFKGKIMGDGESSVLAWVKHNGGTVASNNLADVKEYCRMEKLSLISTDDIMCKACADGMVTEQDAESIWTNMKKRRRKLPDYSFSEAYRRYLNDLPK